MEALEGEEVQGAHDLDPTGREQIYQLDGMVHSLAQRQPSFTYTVQLKSIIAAQGLLCRNLCSHCCALGT